MQQHLWLCAGGGNGGGAGGGGVSGSSVASGGGGGRWGGMGGDGGCVAAGAVGNDSGGGAVGGIWSSNVVGSHVPDGAALLDGATVPSGIAVGTSVAINSALGAARAAAVATKAQRMAQQLHASHLRILISAEDEDARYDCNVNVNVWPGMKKRMCSRDDEVTRKWSEGRLRSPQTRIAYWCERKACLRKILRLSCSCHLHCKNNLERSRLRE